MGESRRKSDQRVSPRSKKYSYTVLDDPFVPAFSSIDDEDLYKLYREERVGARERKSENLKSDLKSRSKKHRRHRRKHSGRIPTIADDKDIHEETTKVTKYRKSRRKGPETREYYLDRDAYEKEDHATGKHAKKSTSRTRGSRKDLIATTRRAIRERSRSPADLDLAHVRIKVYPVMSESKKRYYLKHNLKPFDSRPLKLGRNREVIKVRVEDLGPAMKPVVKNLLKKKSRELLREATRVTSRYRTKKPFYISDLSPSIDSVRPTYKTYYQVKHKRSGDRSRRHKDESREFHRATDKAYQRHRVKSRTATTAAKRSYDRNFPVYETRQMSVRGTRGRKVKRRSSTAVEGQEEKTRGGFQRLDSRRLAGGGYDYSDEDLGLAENFRTPDSQDADRGSAAINHQFHGALEMQKPPPPFISASTIIPDKKNLWSRAAKVVNTLLKLAPMMKGETSRWAESFPPKAFRMPSERPALRDHTHLSKQKSADRLSREDLSLTVAKDIKNLDEELGPKVDSSLGTRSFRQVSQSKSAEEAKSAEQLDDKLKTPLKVRFGPTDIRYISEREQREVNGHQYSVQKSQDRQLSRDIEAPERSGLSSIQLQEPELKPADAAERMSTIGRSAWRTADSRLSRRESSLRRMSDKFLQQPTSTSRSTFQETELKYSEISQQESEVQSNMFGAKLAHVPSVDSSEIETEICEMSKRDSTEEFTVELCKMVRESKVTKRGTSVRKDISLSRRDSMPRRQESIKRMGTSLRPSSFMTSRQDTAATLDKGIGSTRVSLEEHPRTSVIQKSYSTVPEDEGEFRHVDTQQREEETDDSEKYKVDWGVKLRHVETQESEETDESAKHKKDWGVKLRHVETEESEETDESAKHKKDWGVKLRHVETEESEEMDESAKHKKDWGVKLRHVETQESEETDESAKHKKDWGVKLRHVETQESEETDESARHKKDWGAHLKHVDTKEVEETDESARHKKDWGVHLKHVDTKELEESDDSARHKKDWGAHLKHVDTKEVEESDDSARHKKDWGAHLKHVDTKEVEESDDSARHKKDWGAHLKHVDTKEVEESDDSARRKKDWGAHLKHVDTKEVEESDDSARHKKDWGAHLKHVDTKEVVESDDSARYKKDWGISLRRVKSKGSEYTASAEGSDEGSEIQISVKESRARQPHESSVDFADTTGRTPRSSMLRGDSSVRPRSGFDHDRFPSVMRVSRDQPANQPSMLKRMSKSSLDAEEAVQATGSALEQSGMEGTIESDGVGKTEQLDQFRKSLVAGETQGDDVTLADWKSRAMSRSQEGLSRMGSRSIGGPLIRDAVSTVDQIGSTQFSTQQDAMKQLDISEVKESDVESNKHEARRAHVESVASSEVEEELRGAIRQATLVSSSRRGTVDTSRSAHAETWDQQQVLEEQSSMEEKEGVLEEEHGEGATWEDEEEEEEEEEYDEDESWDRAEQEEEEDDQSVSREYEDEMDRKDLTYLSDEYEESDLQSEESRSLEESLEDTVDDKGAPPPVDYTVESQEVQDYLEDEAPDRPMTIVIQRDPSHLRRSQRDSALYRPISTKPVVKPASPFGPELYPRQFAGHHWVPLKEPTLHLPSKKMVSRQSTSKAFYPGYEFGAQ